MIVVSNRLPLTLIRSRSEFELVPSIGGLATGMGSVFPRACDKWIGWPGITAVRAHEKRQIEEALSPLHHVPVFLNDKDVKYFYEGYCNRTIWPAFHHFDGLVEYSSKWWDAYELVNHKFCDAVSAVLKQGEKVWINDYHLMLLPKLLKERNKDCKVGFFLHIPFPTSRHFIRIPRCRDLLRGIYQADNIGFYLPQYRDNFLSASRLLLKRSELEKSLVDTHIGTFPIGIDFSKYNQLARSSGVQIHARRLRKSLRSRIVFLSIDRLDYTKGIPEKLIAFEDLLTEHSEYRGVVCLFLVVVPSRENISTNRKLKKEIDTITSRISKKFGTSDWAPLTYLYNAFPIQDVSAFYAMSDVMIVSSKMDGMNLVCKEFLASRTNNDGVLILSTKAGAAQELHLSVLIDPNCRSITAAYLKAIRLTRKGAKASNKIKQMKSLVRKNSITRWARNFEDSFS